MGVMGPALRALLWCAEWLVPESLRTDWREQWRGHLWLWILKAAKSGAPDSRFALMTHTRDAVRAAIRARFYTEPGLEALRRVFGSPGFCLALCSSFLLLVAFQSGGFRVTRELVRGLPYRAPENVLVLAQGPPFFGIRLGFREQEIETFRKRSQTLDGLATYTWRSEPFRSRHGNKDILAGSVSPNFFQVLGVAPALGRGFDQPEKDRDQFLATYDFWRNELQADPAALGRQFNIGGHAIRLAGVLPRGFSFLWAPISVWTIQDGDEPPPPRQRWWLGLKGAVGRLRPNEIPAQVEKELRGLQFESGFGRRNYRIQATRITYLLYQEPRSYLGYLLACLSGILLVALLRVLRDRRRGMSWRMAVRFWSFFAAKAALPLIALFFFILECTDANRLGMTGGVRAG